ncbi:MAG TPA: MarR family transcriptional regulator [Ktedonobacterales bacterium]|jgi:DNA-binding MarR family transcriptional regulator|nr:MarR family transcriptional regulator [Ktedonobacterales bacterium]
MNRHPFSLVGDQAGRADDERALLIWLRLARIYQKVDHASAERLRAWELSVAQFDTLTQIRAAQGLMQQELADRLLVTKGNISQILDRLAARGLIRRQQEGRASRLYLTEEGQRLMDEVVPGQEAFIAEQLRELDVTERGALLGLLRKIDRALL